MNKKGRKASKKTLELRAVKNTLMTPGTKFKIDSGNHCTDGLTFTTHKALEDKNTTYISNAFYSMNVTKFGPTCITLYTYDMLGTRTGGKIKYDDVTIETVQVTKCVNKETGQMEIEDIEFKINDHVALLD